MQRTASLLPAATEIVCALGARDALVARSHECDFPPEVAGVPVVTRARVVDSGSSAELNRALLERALSIYAVDLDALARARVELILTQDLCAACAVSPADLERDIGARIVSLRPRRLAEIFADIARVGLALDRGKQARELTEILDARVQRVRGRTLRLPRKRVLTIEWLDPLLVGGLWMPELIEIAGGEALLARAGEHARRITHDELRASAPDVVLIKPCGFTIERTRKEHALLEQIVATSRARDAYVADGNAYFNWPGPRIVDSLEILGCCVHGAAFPDLAEKRRAGFVRL